MKRYIFAFDFDMEAQFAFVASDDLIVEVPLDYARVAEAVYALIQVKVD
jgi:hypothetical protein